MDPFGLYSQSTFFVKNREVQYEHFFTVLSHMMPYCGYDPRYLSDCVNETERRILILKNIFYWMLAISAAAMLFLIFFEAWQSHDMGKLALATSTSLTAVVYFLVVGRLQLSKVEIFNFFERFRQNFPSQGHVAVNACLFIQNLSVVFIMLWLVLIIIVCFVPLASILLFSRKILFYPVPEFMMHGLIYFLTYLWSDHIVVFTNLQYLTLTLIIVTLVSLVCLEFDQLAHDVASLKHLDENELSESLPTLVERHIRALELTETLDGFFSIIFLIRFVLSIFAIGIDFFAIMSLKNPSDITALVKC
ncbi:hypothetical protein PVAND_015302 [Polypedilum vanderplanki]|uniref:Uncharacterized protein n=1 Tax=Polypedilum vanderplanki TaxID=319348 RepID=A0A9J6BCM3_POLVA|nr:hypothetical protein PVAND_015302 [Polypedilum vanderplanki]